MKIADCHMRVIFQLLLVACLWSTGGVLIKMVEWNSLAICFVRSLVTLLFLLLFRRGKRLRLTKNSIACALSYAGVAITFVVGNKLTASANVIFLQYIAPIYVALYTIFVLKERPRPFDVVCILLTLGGMALFFVGEFNGGQLAGNLMGFLCGISFAAMAIFSTKNEGSMLDSVLLGSIAICIVTLPWAVGGVLKTPPSGQSVFWLLVSAVVQYAVPYILYAGVIQLATPLEAVLIPSLEPILNPVWVAIFLHEIPGKWAIMGGCIVLISVTAKCISAIKNTAPFPNDAGLRELQARETKEEQPAYEK